MDDMEVDDTDGMDAYRRRTSDLDELLEIAARQLREAELQAQEPRLGDELRMLPAHPRFARHACRMSERRQDEWIDRMRNRFGGEW